MKDEGDFESLKETRNESKKPGTETNANTFNVAVIATGKQVRHLIICKSANTRIKIHIIKILK